MGSGNYAESVSRRIGRSEAVEAPMNGWQFQPSFWTGGQADYAFQNVREELGRQAVRR